MTLGLSPKALNPALTLFAAGVVLVILSAVLTDDGSLRDLGLGAIGSAILGFGVAHQSDPGDVVSQVGPASDDLLLTDRDVRKNLTDERGQSLVDVLIFVVVLILIVVLVRALL